MFTTNMLFSSNHIASFLLASACSCHNLTDCDPATRRCKRIPNCEQKYYFTEEKIPYPYTGKKYIFILCRILSAWRFLLHSVFLIFSKKLNSQNWKQGNCVKSVQSGVIVLLIDHSSMHKHIQRSILFDLWNF